MDELHMGDYAGSCIGLEAERKLGRYVQSNVGRNRKAIKWQVLRRKELYVDGYLGERTVIRHVGV